MLKQPEPFRLGLDVVSLSRVKRIYEKRPCLFMKRFFTQEEAAYCLNAVGFGRKLERFGGRIAAKEAVMKVLGKGWPYIPWTDIEVVHDGLGRPVVHLKGKALSTMENQDIGSIQVSITHDWPVAAAVAMGISKGLLPVCPGPSGDSASDKVNGG